VSGSLAEAAPYAGVLVAAIFEGEVAYVIAASLVAAGRLDALGVLLAGATGATIGDQFYFYLLRGRLARWIGRFPSIDRRAQTLVAYVRRHDTATVLLLRFAPGLRITLAAACAYAGVAPLKFSALNSLSALLWATVVLALVAWVGPAYLDTIGLSGWRGAVAVGLIIVALVQFAAWRTRRQLRLP
jgi:membrane protein DedA with SNARE-associated domain